MLRYTLRFLCRRELNINIEVKVNMVQIICEKKTCQQGLKMGRGTQLHSCLVFHCRSQLISLFPSPSNNALIVLRVPCVFLSEQGLK